MSESAPESTEPVSPTQEQPAVEPTFTETAPMEPTEEVAEADQEVIPFAPSYALISPWFGRAAVTIQWGEPLSGPVDGYQIDTDSGLSYTVPGDVFSVDLVDLPAWQPLGVRVTATKGTDSGYLDVAPTTVQGPNEQEA